MIGDAIRATAEHPLAAIGVMAYGYGFAAVFLAGIKDIVEKAITSTIYAKSAAFAAEQAFLNKAAEKP